MASKAAYAFAVFFIASVCLMTLIIVDPFGWLPQSTDDLPDNGEFGFDLQIEGWLTDKFDETPTTADLEDLDIQIFLVSGESGQGRLFKETVTSTASAGGRFRTSQTYSSGDFVLFVVDGGTNDNTWSNASVIVQMPFYNSQYPPTYHYLSNVEDSELVGGTIQLKRVPTVLPRIYKPTGATMTLGTDISTADWDISTDGDVVTFTIEVYSNTEEAGLGSWYDYEQGYQRTNVLVFRIPKYRTGTTAAVGQDGVLITASSLYLVEAKAPTSAQDGIYVCEVSVDSLNIDKNQQTGQYIEKSSFEIDITFDFSSCGGSANFTMCWSIWRDTNLANWQSIGLDTSGDTRMYNPVSYLLAIAA